MINLMELTLFFFRRANFNSYKKSVSDKGYTIRSISHFLVREKIETLDPLEDIVDITAIATINKDTIQANFESLVHLFDEETIFIADNKYKETFTYELRYCFDYFEDLPIEHEEESSVNKSLKSRKNTKRLVDLTDVEVEKFKSNFTNRLYGHDKFKVDFGELVQNFRIFNKLGEHKILSLFLMGASGVGKTEVARIIHKFLSEKKKIAKINFGNYSSKDALNSLIGSPRGYIGSDGGELFTRVEASDAGIILIDEFEKSNTAVFNYFLDVLENGKLVNSLGEEIDVNGFIIVFTSNISKKNFDKKISPELKSRFDYIGLFNPLLAEDKRKFVEFRFKSIKGKYENEFKKKLPEDFVNTLSNRVRVNDFDNMRDLNKNIKSIFVKYISNLNKNE